jgi:hypothetical protein
MKNLYLLLLALLVLSTTVKSQENESAELSKNSVNFEFGTNFIVSSVSLNFEKYFASTKSGNTNFYGRAGLGGAAVYWGHVGWGGLAGVTMITNAKGIAHFEGNAGIFLGHEKAPPASEDPGTLFVVPILDIGFRYQKPGDSFIFRAKVGTFGIGIGLGYAF